MFDTTRKGTLVGVLVVVLSFVLYNFLYSADRTYNCQIGSEKQVYDGDTLKDVSVKVFDFGSDQYGEVWAGVYVREDGVYIKTDIRINGIDTPEKRVSTKHPDGSPRSEASRHRERQAAYASRQALIDLLEAHRYQIVLSNPVHGKYAGRTVAAVEIGGMDVATFLIENGHAKAYDGGTKPDWEWGK